MNQLVKAKEKEGAAKNNREGNSYNAGFQPLLFDRISRKIAADYASGGNDWKEAVAARQVLDSAKRLNTSSSSF
jgi:hypothetical protein